MKPEYEARFCNIDVEATTDRLKQLGARCVIPKTLMKRMVFENAHLRAKRGWLRLRDEGQSVTLTYKQSTATTSAIDTLLEAEVGISDFAGGQQLLEALGFEPLRYQENYREEWALDGVKLDFDTWPGLPTFLEIEGPNEESVKLAAKKLGLNFADATFGSVDEVYSRELGIDILQKPELTFDCR